MIYGDSSLTAVNFILIFWFGKSSIENNITRGAIKEITKTEIENTPETNDNKHSYYLNRYSIIEFNSFISLTNYYKNHKSNRNWNENDNNK